MSEQEQIELQEQYLDGAISAIKISDYNDIIRLTGQEAIPLQEDEVLVVSNYGRLNDALDQYMQGESIINIEGEAYTIKREVSSALVIGQTMNQVPARVIGLPEMIVFVGLFLGLIFLISSVAVMELQQLSDATDSVERYKSLKRIGVTETLINKAILKQNLIYFLVPLGLAIIHSIVGISLANEIFNTYNQNIIIGSSLLVIALVLVIIYGGYFYATYVGVKNIVKNSN